MITEGNKQIQKAIDRAVSLGEHKVHITGEYEIMDTILIPSDMTLILEDCYLRMGDDTQTQMFRNAGFRQGEVNRLADCDRNIQIIGLGRAILDGGKYNGICEHNCGKEGRPHISVNNMLLFSNVKGFCVQGLHIRNQRWWALNFLFCSDGCVRDIDFCADDTWENGDGTESKGLHRNSWGGDRKPRIVNADGVDLRLGCHDILIENITGFTEDDTVALTALNGTLERMYNVEDAPRAIYNVQIRNVRSEAFCTGIRLLNQGGTKLYNVLIDGVMDTSAGSEHMDRGIYSVRIGDVHMYGDRHATKEETYNLTVRNVYSRCKVAVNLAGAMDNVVLDNINGFDGNEILVEDLRTKE